MKKNADANSDVSNEESLIDEEIYLKITRSARIFAKLLASISMARCGKDDFADGMSHLHRLHPLSADEDNLPCVVVDAHGKELTVPVRCLLADLGLLITEVAFIHPDLSAEGPGRHVALKKGLICRPECVYRFHTVLYL